MPLIRVAPSAISGNNAWGMVPSSWRVPGDLDNHGRYHFYFPLSILVHPDDDHPNPISASRYPQRPSTQTLRRSGGLSLEPGAGLVDGHRPGILVRFVRPVVTDPAHLVGALADAHLDPAPAFAADLVDHDGRVGPAGRVVVLRPVVR